MNSGKASVESQNVNVKNHQKSRYFIHAKYKSKLQRMIVLTHLFLLALLVLFINSCNSGSKIAKAKEIRNDNTKEDITHIFCENEPSEISLPKKKNIYLTFDDGPNRGTMNVFELLEKRALPATFFVIGSHIFGSKKQTNDFNTLRNSRSCELANHTYYHAHNRYIDFYKNTDKVLKDFQLMDDSLGILRNIVRTPANNSWRTCNINYDTNKKIRKAVDTLFAHEYKVVGWDIEWKLGKDKLLTKSAAELANEIDQYIKENQTLTENEVVILLHDQHFVNTENINQLDTLLGILVSNENYDFKKISQYPNL